MRKVKRPNFKKILVNDNATTEDIIIEVMDVVKKSDPKDILGFIQKNKITPTYEGLSKLWTWVKDNVEYEADEADDQAIQTANYTFYKKEDGTDCKSFTVFMAKCFECLGLKYKVRFAGYTHSAGEITHVYPIAILPNGQNVIMDAVWNKFDKEKKISTKKDFIMSKIYRVSGASASVGNIFQNLKTFFSNATIGKFSIMFMHAFFPSDIPLVKGSRTQIKVAKGQKALKFLLKKYPFNDNKLVEKMRKAIKTKIGVYPEDYFRKIYAKAKPVPVAPTSHNVTDGTTTGRRGVNGAIGEPVTTATATLIVGLVSAVIPLFLSVINKESGADMTKDDVLINDEELLNDTTMQSTGEGSSDDYKESRARTDNSNSGGADADSNNKQMMYVVGFGVLGYLAFK